MAKTVKPRMYIEYQNEHGQMHREDGPAYISYDGLEVWLQNNEQHRDDGPAVNTTSGYRYWAINGKMLRDDGPVFVWPNGLKKWCYYVEKVSNWPKL